MYQIRNIISHIFKNLIEQTFSFLKNGGGEFNVNYSTLFSKSATSSKEEVALMKRPRNCIAEMKKNLGEAPSNILPIICRVLINFKFSEYCWQLENGSLYCLSSLCPIYEALLGNS